MPISEVADRFTIAMLKLERLPEDEISKEDLKREVDLYSSGLNWHHIDLAYLIGDLYRINGLMWDAEHEIRKGQDEKVGLEEIGRRALRIRDLNRERVQVKNAIIELTGSGFKDCKMNSTQYARPAPHHPHACDSTHQGDTETAPTR